MASLISLEQLTMADFNLPNQEQRHVVIGRTGSGKTTFGLWILSNASFDTMPFVMIDFKKDKTIAKIPFVEEIDYKSKVGKNGLYVIRPHPDDAEAVDQLLRRIWEKEHTGIFIDEALEMPDKGGIRAVLTQGRSKKIPVIALTQRPLNISRYFFTESDFFSVFHLNDKDDKKVVTRYTSMNLDNVIPRYHSKYFDVADNRVFNLRPSPDEDTILEKFYTRLAPKNRII